MLTPITIDSLGDLDNGTVRAMVNREIDKATDDLLDRGAEDGKPRKVMIELELTLQEGRVVANVAAQAKGPPRRSRFTVASPKIKDGKHRLLFQTENAENPDQPTFKEFDQPKDEPA